MQARLSEVLEYTHAPPPVQLDPEHTTHVPAQRYQEICQRFGFARSYIGRLYSDVHERVRVGEQEATEASVRPVQCCEPASSGGGAASDEARGRGHPARLF
ncbi:hypothetical protein JCGZ_08417 [Jatropha curcas]|uniref:Aminotransferase-like plant mobile domain-containing protein n=1 Tax=Jatropha curcas TaxID=180498 RepID=A0A067JLC4_JATCU|nr:hypothetical protein JCGZ_08417 [Jatropha curcas]